MLKKQIIKKLNEIDKKLEKTRALELYYIIGSKKEIIFRNLIAGVSRGVGIGIGVTIITAVLVYILKKIIMLNIPILGDYITDIVSIVQKNL